MTRTLTSTVVPARRSGTLLLSWLFSTFWIRPMAGSFQRRNRPRDGPTETAAEYRRASLRAPNSKPSDYQYRALSEPKVWFEVGRVLKPGPPEPMVLSSQPPTYQCRESRGQPGWARAESPRTR